MLALKEMEVLKLKIRADTKDDMKEMLCEALKGRTFDGNRILPLGDNFATTEKTEDGSFTAICVHMLTQPVKYAISLYADKLNVSCGRDSFVASFFFDDRTGEIEIRATDNERAKRLARDAEGLREALRESGLLRPTA